jgi:WD40 repeat protein
MLRVALCGLILVALAFTHADLASAQPVLSLAFSPDCKTVIGHGVDYTIRHWDVSTAEELGRFVGDDWWSRDNPEQFSILHVIDNNSLLHTAAHGLALLDLKTGKERVVTELARGKPSWISPDGKRIVTYGKQGSWSKRTATATFTLWDLEQAYLKTLRRKPTREQNSRPSPLHRMARPWPRPGFTFVMAPWSSTEWASS